MQLLLDTQYPSESWLEVFKRQHNLALKAAYPSAVGAHRDIVAHMDNLWSVLAQRCVGMLGSKT
jgi:hypothetical protein